MSATDVPARPGGVLALDATMRKEESLAKLAWRRFRRHRMAMVGALILLGLVLYIIVGSLVFSEADANYNDVTRRYLAPGGAFLFGTDEIGRDVLARTIYGGQISLVIGVVAALISVVVGTLTGALAGYYGGLLDSVLMRITEAMLTIPQIFLLLVMAKFFGNRIGDVQVLGRTFSGSVIVIVLIIGATSWMYLARIVRSTYLSLREQEFVTAAHCIGVSTPRIIFGHILPNAMAPIIVAATLGVAGAIITEAYISFLGLGVRAPTATWGSMMQGATSAVIQGHWWLWFFPGLMIVLTTLGINFIGDGLRDALDPHSIR
ncbi:MAG: ABC transporter permease [Anaerolineae bacterium]|nr:ABC transporter permease [Anaerolineae bacterium]